MNLDVDIGNTRIKWRTGPSAAVHAAPLETWRELFMQLPADIGQVRVCNVLGPDMERSLTTVCQARWQITPRFARVVARHNYLQVLYDDPATLGVDRWLAMLAASACYPQQDMMVVSGGTAVTVDLVGKCGGHAGGFILPGLGTASRALFAAAPRLPSEPVHMNSAWDPGSNTEACLSAGFSALYQGLFLAILQRQPQNFFAERAVFTGGDGRALMVLCEATIKNTCFQADLVLDGLVSALPD